MNTPSLIAHLQDIVRDTYAADGPAALQDPRLWEAVRRAIEEEHEKLKEAARQVAENQMVLAMSPKPPSADQLLEALNPLKGIDLMPNPALTPGRMEERDQQADQLAARLADALWEVSALRHGLHTPEQFRNICRRVIASQLHQRNRTPEQPAANDPHAPDA